MTSRSIAPAADFWLQWFPHRGYAVVGLEARVHFVVVDIFDALHKIQYLVIKRRASAGGLMSAPSLTGWMLFQFFSLAGGDVFLPAIYSSAYVSAYIGLSV